jgi:glycosyltransferase involved in cell wall biosynthesis
MKLCDKITIVVPCKNEENYIHHLLDSLRSQNIGDTRVIIADCSTDATRQVIKNNSIGLNVEIIDGGPVSIAKNSGARLVTTPYILFIDADVRFFKDTVIRDAVNKMELKKLHLVGLNIKCYDKDIRAKVGFTAFNIINHTLKFFTPFAVGAFMLTRKDKFEEYGGFPENLLTSEDYFLSKKYSPRKFKIIRHYLGQDSRRFKKMGYLGMGKYLVKNFVNRNNKKYWESLYHNRYWN